MIQRLIKSDSSSGNLIGKIKEMVGNSYQKSHIKLIELIFCVT